MHFIIYVITQQKKKDLVEVVNIFPDILKVSYSVHFSFSMVFTGVAVFINYSINPEPIQKTQHLALCLQLSATMLILISVSCRFEADKGSGVCES